MRLDRVELAVQIKPCFPHNLRHVFGTSWWAPICRGVDDTEAYFYEHYACGSERNYTNYCNPELEKMYDQQSVEPDQEKRKKLVWEIDRQLQEDAARPIIYQYRLGTCHYPRVHGITVMVNSIFNGWRFEDAR